MGIFGYACLQTFNKGDKMKIISNGSKFAGEENDTIETLINVLKAYDLDVESHCMTGFMSFDDNTPKESKTSFIDLDNENITISGNFVNISHVFNIRGTYKELESLRWAVKDNVKRVFEKLNKNAKRIVKCWNMHDELVGVCKAVVAEMVSMEAKDENSLTLSGITTDKLNDMIKQAEEE